MIELRSYQLEADQALRASMRSGHRSPLEVLPCGAGKTVLFCHFCQGATAKGKRVMILSHREELVEQISKTLDEFGVRHGFVTADKVYDDRHLATVASIMSLASRLKRGLPIAKPDLLIIDEAHHGVAGSWKRVLEMWPDVPRIGVTATPQRLSGEPLGEVFDDLIVGPTAGQLIQLGALSPYVVIAPEVDVAELRRRGADFDLKQAAKKRKPQIVGDAIANYVKYAAGKRFVLFEVTVDKAKESARLFEAAGFRVACIDGSMAKADRKELVKMFRDGFLDGLTTCDLISEGFDLPAIEVAICLRPTESLALWIQQFGRALRPFPGKERAIILDHAGNTMRHLWLPESEVEWSLSGKAKIKGLTDSGPAVRTCPFCHAAQFATAGLDSCKVCGCLFNVGASNGREIKKVEGNLVEVDPELLARIATQRRIEQGRAQTYAELVEVFRKKGEKNPMGHARHVWNARLAKQAKLDAERAARHGAPLLTQEF